MLQSFDDISDELRDVNVLLSCFRVLLEYR